MKTDNTLNQARTNIGSYPKTASNAVLKKLDYASFFNPVRGVLISDETLVIVFDILLKQSFVIKRKSVGIEWKSLQHLP